jgi:hypothetical protein
MPQIKPTLTRMEMKSPMDAYDAAQNQKTIHKQMKITVFLEKQSGKWFYVFSRDWSTYRSNQGYNTKDAAEEAGFKHWQSLILH